MGEIVFCYMNFGQVPAVKHVHFRLRTSLNHVHFYLLLLLNILCVKYSMCVIFCKAHIYDILKVPAAMCLLLVQDQLRPHPHPFIIIKYSMY